MENMNDVKKEAEKGMVQMTRDYPDFMNGFQNFMKECKKDSVLPSKTKSLIAISLAVATHCSWCIALHVKEALNQGATKDEIMETCFVATLMGGGPSLMYTNMVRQAINDMQKE